jgi:hypothetical protein
MASIAPGFRPISRANGASEYFVYSQHDACAVEVRHRRPRTVQDKRKDGGYQERVRLGLKVHFVVEDAYDFDRPPAVIGPHVSFGDRDDLA